MEKLVQVREAVIAKRPQHQMLLLEVVVMVFQAVVVVVLLVALEQTLVEMVVQV
jgi:hypothetical protein